MHAPGNSLAKNQEAKYAESVSITSIVSQCAVHKTIASISESSGGLKNEFVLCDELDMDITVNSLAPNDHCTGRYCATPRVPNDQYSGHFR